MPGSDQARVIPGIDLEEVFPDNDPQRVVPGSGPEEVFPDNDPRRVIRDSGLEEVFQDNDPQRVIPDSGPQLVFQVSGDSSDPPRGVVLREAAEISATAKGRRRLCSLCGRRNVPAARWIRGCRTAAEAGPQVGSV